jgi:hypothetical protein
MPEYHDSRVINEYGDVTVNVNRIGLKAPSNPREWLQMAASDPLNIEPEEIRYWVDTPLHHYLFEGANSERRALAWGAVVYRSGIEKMNADPDVVPIEVAILGTAYVAAYMFAIHEYGTSAIAERIGVSKQTVTQYISDVIDLRR